MHAGGRGGSGELWWEGPIRAREARCEWIGSTALAMRIRALELEGSGGERIHRYS